MKGIYVRCYSSIFKCDGELPAIWERNFESMISAVRWINHNTIYDKIGIDTIYYCIKYDKCYQGVLHFGLNTT